MSDWQPIESAPKDGTPVRAGKSTGRFGVEFIPYPLTSRFLNGQWCCDMGDRWAPYDPQPTHWTPLSAGHVALTAPPPPTGQG